MGSTWGNALKLSIFGESHGAGIGVVMDGLPAGQPIDLEDLQLFMDRRAPGRTPWSTSRREGDQPRSYRVFTMARQRGLLWQWLLKIQIPDLKIIVN